MAFTVKVPAILLLLLLLFGGKWQFWLKIQKLFTWNHSQTYFRLVCGKSVSDLFTHTIWAYFVCLNFQHMTVWKKERKGNKIRSWIFPDMFCGFFVFQTHIKIWPVLGLGLHMTQVCTSCCCNVSFWIMLLCSLSAEFLGSSKQGLYFCCRVGLFSIFLAAVLKLFWDNFHWEQNETEKKWKYSNWTIYFYF